MPQDENSGGVSPREGGPKRGLKLVAAVLAASAAFTLSVLTSGLGLTNVIVSFLCFAAASVIMTFLFLHEKTAAVLAPPAIAVGVALILRAQILPSLLAAAMILILSGAAAVMLLKRASQFTLFLVVSALFFGAMATLAVTSLKTACGSVSVGIGELKVAVAGAVESSLELLRDSDTLNDLSLNAGALTDALFAVIPAGAMILSMIASAVYFGVLKLLARAAGTRDLLFPEKLVTPAPFAALYVVSVILYLISSTFRPPFSYAVINLNYVLMAYFAGIGFAELMRSVLGSGSRSKKRTAIIIILTAVVLIGWLAFAMFIPILMPVLSYFGVFRTFRARKKAG